MRPRQSLLAAIFTLSAGVALRADDVHVPGDFPTVQAAIDAAAHGDVIHIASGTWPGALAIHDKSLVLVGAGPDVTILHGQGAPAALFVSSTLGNSLEVSNLAITGAVKGLETVGEPDVLLTSCIVRGNTDVGASGRITATGCSFVDNGSHGLSEFQMALDCTFAGNGGWGAYDVSGVNGPYVADSRFLGNGLGGARLVSSSPHPTFIATQYVQRCTFLGDDLELSAFEFSGQAQSTVSRSTFVHGSIILLNGSLSVDNSILWASNPLIDAVTQSHVLKIVWSDVMGGLAGVGNIDADPQFADPGAGDVSLLPGSPCINTGKPDLSPDPDGSPPDMGAVTYHPWSDAGHGLAGSNGPGHLEGGGPLIAVQEVTLSLDSALPGAAAWLVVGLSELSAPFKGGTLWPQIDALVGPSAVSSGGSLQVAGPWPADLPHGFTFFTQAVWPDASAVEGWAASNAVKGVQP